ncbi:hypothetical protein F5Y18DRAFT_400776 [Xylariaceae sp. FL1019]|nr:hypothetical protein F5Y18DRAFT_400776 [Xylariaceae sp. FL1019]
MPPRSSPPAGHGPEFGLLDLSDPPGFSFPDVTAEHNPSYPYYYRSIPPPSLQRDPAAFPEMHQPAPSPWEQIFASVHPDYRPASPHKHSDSHPLMQRPSPPPAAELEAKSTPPEFADGPDGYKAQFQIEYKDAINIKKLLDAASTNCTKSKGHTRTTSRLAASDMGDNNALNKFLMIRRADFSSGKEFLRECERLRGECAKHWNLGFTRKFMICHLIRALQSHRPGDAEILRRRHLKGKIDFGALKEYISAPDLVREPTPEPSGRVQTIVNVDNRKGTEGNAEQAPDSPHYGYQMPGRLTRDVATQWYHPAPR